MENMSGQLLTGAAMGGAIIGAWVVKYFTVDARQRANGYITSSRVNEKFKDCREQMDKMFSRQLRGIENSVGEIKVDIRQIRDKMNGMSDTMHGSHS